MKIQDIYTHEEITELAKERFGEERSLDHLEGWFLARECAMKCDAEFKEEPDCIRIAKTLVRVAETIPLDLGDYHLLAGTQDDAFARSYALINPAFTVDSTVTMGSTMVICFMASIASRIFLPAAGAHEPFSMMATRRFW